MTGPSQPSPVRLRVALAPRAARSLANLLGMVGAQVDASQVGERTVVVASFAAAPPHLEDRVEAWLGTLRSEPPETLETARGDGPWRPGWEAVFEGGPLGAGFWVRPPWVDAAAPPGRIELVVDPRGGFGGGRHPSTEAAVRALEAAAPLGDARLLDVGAGTGVLSLVAARLGWRPTAIDTVSTARACCARTAARNQIDVRILDARIEEVEERFECVVANLPRGLLEGLAGPLCDRLAPGGVLILSGLREPDVDAVAAGYPAFQSAGLVVVGEGEDAWASLTLNQREAPRG